MEHVKIAVSVFYSHKENATLALPSTRVANVQQKKTERKLMITVPLNGIIFSLSPTFVGPIHTVVVPGDDDDDTTGNALIDPTAAPGHLFCL